MYQTLKQKKILSVLLTHYLHKNTTKKREKVYYDVIDVPACISPWTCSTFFLSFLVTAFKLWKDLVPAKKLVPAISSSSSSRIIASGRSLEKSSFSMSLLGGLMFGLWLRQLRKSMTFKKQKTKKMMKKNYKRPYF